MGSGKKKKILIISLNIPYPLVHGGAIAQYFFLKNLSSCHDITLCSFTRNEEEIENLTILSRKLPEIKIISTHKKDISSGSPLKVLLRKIYYKLRSKRADLNDQLSSLSMLKFVDNEFVKYLQKHFEQNSYDIVQMEFFETLPLVAILPQVSKKIFINHEITSKKLELSTPDVSNKKHHQQLISTIKSIEQKFLNSFDKIIVFSQEDKNYLKNFRPDVLISPFGIPDELITKREISENFNRFIFLGSESHEPNKEGLTWFLDHIYTLNNHVIDWPIYVCGVWSNNFQEVYKGNPKIIFTGFVQDLSPLFENSVLLNPIRSGSGIRTKILQAFVNKVPVLSTWLGSEGLADKFSANQHLLQFSNQKDFLEIFSLIKNDRDYLIKITENAHQFYFSNFTNTALISNRNEAYF